jgi:hypothetical protein
MRFVKLTLLLILILPSWSTVHAQYVEKPGIRLVARATDRSVKLRWAPNHPTVWQLANKYGYTIERTLVTENDRFVTSREKKLLTTAPIRPAAQPLWEKLMDTNDYVAVAAQAIFGQTFELTNNQSTDVLTVINKAKELESRFSFAVFAADQSMDAAALSGLYFEDETIAPRNKYLYRIYTNIPKEVYIADTAFVFIGLQDYQPLPSPQDLRADFQDHHVTLSWNGELLNRIYNAYWVERSPDGKTFAKISSQPTVNAYPGERPKTDMVFKMDSLPQNNFRYYYRVRGINAFGETGPPSDTVSGVGRPLFAYSAAIGDHIISDSGKVTLNWTFPREGADLLHSFDLVRVDIKTKLSEKVASNLTRATRSVVDATPRSTNYYVIRAKDKFGRSNDSFPYLVQLEDSIPPPPPVGLEGWIDSVGHVFLKWEKTSEEDLLGYTVFRANFQSDEFIQISGPIRKQNEFVDTIRLNNLTERIYYKVTAMDKRFNPSGFSEILTLKKPDKIAPVVAVFTSITCDSIGISVSWKPSSSNDVVQHLLYRRRDIEKEWTLVKMMPLNDSLSAYQDTDVVHGEKYSYTIIAVDDSGLESTPAVPLNIRFVLREPFPPVAEVFHKIDKDKRMITLRWTYDQDNIEKFLIYKSVDDMPPRVYTSVEGAKRELVDHYLPTQKHVEYRIVVNFKTGEKTKLSIPFAIEM